MLHAIFEVPSSFAPDVIGYVLRLLCSVSIVLCVAAVAGVLFRRSSAAVRHRVWSLSLLATLVLPVALLALPEWRLGRLTVQGAQQSVEENGAAADAVAATAPGVAHPVSAPDTAPPEAGWIRPAPVDVAPDAGRAAPADALTPGTGRTELVRAAARAEARTASWVWLVLAWLAPMVWLLLRELRAHITAYEIARAADAVNDAAVRALFARLIEGLGVRSGPALLQTTAIAAPICTGVLRPRLLLPVAWTEWPVEQLRAVLTHELAHVARRDVLWQSIARVACAIYWFHPLAWVAAWRMRVERELACDDWVLRGGETSTRYARWLLDVATDLRESHRLVQSAGVAMASGHNFQARIAAILDPHRRRRPVTRRTAAALAAAALLLLAFAGVVSPLAPRPALAQDERPRKIAGSDAPEPDAKPEPKYRVSGRVLDEQGRPVAGATVESSVGAEQHTATTDADGGFVLESNVADARFGFFDLWARSADRTRQCFLQLNEGKAVERATDVRVMLKPAREMPVTVVDAKGQPVPDAWVGVSMSYRKAGEATTDREGKATLRIPPDVPPMYVVARKPGLGLDYVLFWRKDETRTDPYRLEPDHRGPISFVLDGVKTVTVKVVDEAGKPIDGVSVYPWYFERPKKGGHLNLSGLDEFKGRTDANGVATFEVPTDNTTGVQFWTRKEGWTAPKRTFWKPESGDVEVTSVMLPLVPVAGRVLDERGDPAGNVLIRVGGANYEIDDFHGEVRTRPDGTFKIDVAPDKFYVFAASDGRLAAPVHTRMIRRESKTPVELKLAPGTHIVGRMTAGPDRKPVQGVSVSLYQSAGRAYYELPEAEQFPGGTTGRRWLSPMVFHQAESDEKGLVEFYLPPGEYTSWAYFPGPQHPQVHKEVKVIDRTPVEVEYHQEEVRTEPRIVKGRVVERDRPDVAVAEATVTIAHLDHNDRSRAQATSDRAGGFTLQRGKSDFYLHADVAGGDRQGLVLVRGDADIDQVKIPVGPTASARGRVLDHEGQPVAAREFKYGIHVGLPSQPFWTGFGRDKKTDDAGRFEIQGLVPGFEYEISVATEFTDEPDQRRPRAWQTVGKARAERVEQVDLGDLKLSAPYKPKTPDDYAREAMAPQTDFRQKLEKARRTARFCYQNVLVVIGTAESASYKQLFQYRHDFDQREAYTALREHVLVVVNAATPEAGARQWAETNKVPWAGEDGGISLAVLDKEGKVLARVSGEAMASPGVVLDREKLIAFATEHAPPKPDAQRLLDEAKARAAREGKKILVEETSAYCSWCVKLGEYLEANRDVLGKEYVLVTLDRRLPNGERILAALRGPREGSTPWMVILDADGTKLISSDAADGNIGYPGEPAGRQHWEKMLRTGTSRLTDEEIRQLVAKLAAP